MKGFAIRVHIPVASLGRLRLPVKRHRTRWGYVRFGWAPARDKVIVTLEDQHGVAVRVPDMTQVRIVARLVGMAACRALQVHNRYEAGEHPGNPQTVLISSVCDPVQLLSSSPPCSCHS